MILCSSGLSKFNFLHLGYRNPPPPNASLDEAEIIPEVTASWLSLLTVEWISPILRLGYSRPLEATDLYKLQDDRSSGVIAEKIIRSFEERQKKAAEYNSRLASGDISPGLKAVWWSIRGQREEREKEWREKSGKKRASLTLAVNDSVFWLFWSGGILRLISGVALITSSLLVKVLSSLLAPPNLTSLSGHHSVRPTLLHRPSYRTGRPTDQGWHQPRVWSLLPSDSVVIYSATLLLPCHGHRCLVARGIDYRDLQQGYHALHSFPAYPPQWKTSQLYLH